MENLNTEIELYLKFPFIMQYVTENKMEYKGKIFVKNRDYSINVTQFNHGPFEIDINEELMFIKKDIDEFLNHKNTKTDIITLLMKIEDILEKRIVSTNTVNLSHLEMKILHEYTEFTKFYINLKSCQLAYDFSKINISVLDESNREHFLEVKINENEVKNIFQLVGYDLPCLPGVAELFKANSSLNVLFDQFLGKIEILQPFFDFMDMLDKYCWIIDPIRVFRRCDYRRICLEENFSVIVTVNPYNITARPDLKYLGPEILVEKYRNQLNDYLENWNANGDLFQELLDIIGIECFPQKPENQENNIELLKQEEECSICFCLRLNNKLPDIICKNSCCHNCYHEECLYEWLISVNARRVFNEVTGQCPNCEKVISCRIPD